MQNIPMHVYSFLRAQKSLLCACKSVYILLFFILAALYVVTLRKSMKIKIFTDDCIIYQYKAEIMLHEPFRLNVV